MPATKTFSVTLVLLILLLNGCALGPTKAQKREMAFNLVFNVITVRAAATLYGITNIFSFGTDKLLDSFDDIADSDKNRVKAFAELSEQMPEGMMKVVAKLRPHIHDLIFKKPEYLDKFVDTAIYREGVKMAKKAERFGLPDLTAKLDDKQIGLWMQVFMSSKEKVKNIAEPLADWGKQAGNYFNVNWDPKSWM